MNEPDVGHKLSQLIVTPNNINAAGVVVQYWTRSVHIAIWMGESTFAWWSCQSHVSRSHIYCIQ